MIRDTFEANPGLQELFKRKMLERAHIVGLSEDLIDFEARIDRKGTYHDNLQAFYREYPQLAQESDYLRIKTGHTRPLSGAALEQSWRSYKVNNEHDLSKPRRESVGQPIVPELTVTYTIARGSDAGWRDMPEEPEPVPAEPKFHVEIGPAMESHRELIGVLFDRFTAMAGEKVTRKILHQVGQEIAKTALRDSRGQVPPSNLFEALDHALRSRGWGHVIDLDKAEHESTVTYVCTIQGNSLYDKRTSSPTWEILSGIVSRCLESLVQRTAENIQATMVPGSHQCDILVTFRK